MSINNNQQIHHFRMVGVNYKKTDAAIRGMYAVSADQYENLLANATQFGVSDLFVISTCNRTELYGFAEQSEQLMNLLCSVTVGDLATLAPIAYLRDEAAAMEHLFHVAAGLDSQILGDFEILGQIKNSVKFAKERGHVGSMLERIINSVYQSAKAIKTNTALSGGTVSVSFAAVQFVKEHFGDVSNKKIILLGTGKIGKATCKNLVDYLQTRNITLLNRTEETAQQLAQELNVTAAPYSDLENQIAEADVIMVSTGAMEPVIWRHQLEGKGAKLIIDLSVPRNVDITARELPEVTLVDVDILSRIKDETLARRQAEVPKAKSIIREHIAEFMEWYRMRKYIPVLNEVKGKLKNIYIAPSLIHAQELPLEKEQEEIIGKVINNMAAKMRRKNTVGCHYIEAINDYFVIHG